MGSPDTRLATHDVGPVTGALRTLRLQTARDAARGRLLTLGAGLFAAGALIFTARNFILSRRTFELTEQGQVTDRYTKAIEQLGSNTIDVTIGGIYALVLLGGPLSEFCDKLRGRFQAATPRRALVM
jgi:hypothetical protein